jgi:hypothetical protein
MCRVIDAFVDRLVMSELGCEQLAVQIQLQQIARIVAGSSCLSGGSSENAALEELLSESISFLDPHRLIALAIPWNAPQKRVSDDVVLLDRTDSETRVGVLACIEELSDRLVARRRETISDELVLAWAHLLADSGGVNQRAQTNAAGSVLSFALEERGKPVGPLIVVAFPIVYAELRAGGETPGFTSQIGTGVRLRGRMSCKRFLIPIGRQPTWSRLWSLPEI